MRNLFLYFLLALSAPAFSQITVKTMTYNIKHGQDGTGGINLVAVSDAIVAEDPDFVCLQEVDDNAIRSGLVDQTMEIAVATGFTHYRYVPTGTYAETLLPPYVNDHPKLPGLYASDIGINGHRGIALLSRYPIIWQNTTFYEGYIHPRAVFKAKVSTPRGHMFVGCTHFPTRTVDRQVMVADINARAPANLTTFFGGDFNAEPGDVEIDDLQSVWEDPTDGLGLLTFSVVNPNRQIDFFFGKNTGATSTNAYVVTGAPSDHFPLVVEWTIP